MMTHRCHFSILPLLSNSLNHNFLTNKRLMLILYRNRVQKKVNAKNCVNTVMCTWTVLLIVLANWLIYFQVRKKSRHFWSPTLLVVLKNWRRKHRSKKSEPRFSTKGRRRVREDGKNCGKWKLQNELWTEPYSKPYS